jgi:hypothetical protein
MSSARFGVAESGYNGITLLHTVPRSINTWSNASIRISSAAVFKVDDDIAGNGHNGCKFQNVTQLRVWLATMP